MLSHRLQVLLDEDRLSKLQALAASRGESVGAVVREAIDAALRAPAPRRESAAAFLGTPPVRVGEPRELDRLLEGESESR